MKEKAIFRLGRSDQSKPCLISIYQVDVWSSSARGDLLLLVQKQVGRAARGKLESTTHDRKCQIDTSKKSESKRKSRKGCDHFNGSRSSMMIR